MIVVSSKFLGSDGRVATVLLLQLGERNAAAPLTRSKARTGPLSAISTEFRSDHMNSASAESHRKRRWVCICGFCSHLPLFLLSFFCTLPGREARSKSVMPGEGSPASCRPGSPRTLDRPLKTGWLKKQRSIVKNWQARYFVLRGHTLYYHKDDKDSSCQVRGGGDGSPGYDCTG